MSTTKNWVASLLCLRHLGGKDDRNTTEARDQAAASEAAITMEGGGGGKWEEKLTLRASRGAGRTKDMEKGGSKSKDMGKGALVGWWATLWRNSDMQKTF